MADIIDLTHTEIDNTHETDVTLDLREDIVQSDIIESNNETTGNQNVATEDTDENLSLYEVINSKRSPKQQDSMKSRV
jgi:hypothetical protein